jgi:pSer/pThr/pTyr-binding forkhead associated (FHA) protein/tRNA A-37 threonylcarbamoyl transferase component Bud32
VAGGQLMVTEGDERGKLLSVEGELLIGRVAAQDDGRLGEDPEISRRHARLSRGADGYLTIEDLGSANGTFVNGERIDAPRTLDIGDAVRMGRTVLKVTDGPAAESEDSGAPATAPAREHAAEPEQPGEELMITAGAGTGRRLPLADELVIGRAVGGEGQLSDDHELSRRHARLVRGPGGRLGVEDLGSANGTFVNGERVHERRVLELGDLLRVGSTTLQLVHAGREPAPPAPAAAPAAPLPAPPPEVPLPASAPAPARRPPAQAPAAQREDIGFGLPLGSSFAGCRLEEVISSGGMAVVYRAEELALQRRVAVKLILPEHSGEERFRERFRRESKVAAAIDHPNVIPIFDAGEEDGLLFITMRLVEGTDMRALITAEGRIEPLRAARIIRQVGAALDAVHAQGMLHRDVKPSNILLARDDHAYLSDFGFAKPAASVGGLTRQESIVARAEYVAPEQILNERVDGRADIYALGCLLFEALTGEAPFARWTEGPQVLAHLNAPRPSPVELCPELPFEFNDVVRRAMATDPNERYPSGSDLGQAALVAAGGMRRASPWSVVATGEAAPSSDRAPAIAREPPGEAPAASPRAPARERAARSRADTLSWAIALAALAIVAVGMVAALRGISTL